MIRTTQDLFMYKLFIANREISAKEMANLIDKDINSVHSLAQHLMRRDLILKRTIFTGKSHYGNAPRKTYFRVNPKKISRYTEYFKEELENGS